MSIQFNYVYRQGESPEERLRNKLQPFFTLVTLVEQDPTSEHTKKTVATCKVVMEDIKDILTDIKPFYSIVEPKYTQNNTFEDENN